MTSGSHRLDLPAISVRCPPQWSHIDPLRQYIDVAARTRTSDVVLMDACALSDAIRAKRLSCVEVMGAYLDQIERFNPTVNAIVSLDGESNWFEGVQLLGLSAIVAAVFLFVPVSAIPSH